MKKTPKKKPIQGAIAVQGKVLPVWEIDCSSWIGDIPLDQWTRGPILPVGADAPPAKNRKRSAKTRSKKTKGK